MSFLFFLASGALAMKMTQHRHHCGDESFKYLDCSEEKKSTAALKIFSVAVPATIKI